jgi:16S rRNA (guanine966-N2)-methyltransferase
MRVTGGVWASRRLAGPTRGLTLRPTPDFLREQGFAILSPHLTGALFADLFAGTGAVSCEALSRGAQRVFMLERERRALAILNANLAVFEGALMRADVIAGSVAAGLRRLAREGVRCSVAWCDPPFAAWEEGVKALTLARELGVVGPGGLVVLETPPRRAMAPDGYSCLRELRGAMLLRCESILPPC